MGNSISYTTTPHELDLGSKGKIRGLQYDNKSRRYAGVPYALPPTGQHRWRKPRPFPADHIYRGDDDNKNTAYDATEFRQLCPQKAFHVGEGGSADKYSEDCLFVNIWTPVEKPCDDKNKAKKWPVMLWLHGGWFQLGDPSHETYMDPTELISSGGLDAIVVAIGYRLNVFGFLAGQALLEEGGGEAAGNYGLWDQRLGAEWVRDNIAAFGGDPDNITLAGRSAGAYSVEAQMLYELRSEARGDAGEKQQSLYRRAFMDSNAIPAQPKSLADAEPQFDELCAYFQIAKSLSPAEKLAKLREVEAGDLVACLEKLKNHTFRPVTDGIFVQDGMMQYIRSPDFAQAFKERGYKLLIGEVLNEETLYATYNSPEEPTIEALKVQIGNYYAPATVDRALDYYELPKGTDLQQWKTCFGEFTQRTSTVLMHTTLTLELDPGRIIADGQVRAPSRALAQNLLQNGVPLSDIWRYQIAYRLSFIDEKIAPMCMGVAHAMDKPFWK